jgi:hypothetical protein
MNTSVADTSKKMGIEGRGAAAEIKCVILKIAKALTFNADAVLKSKDWPYLWPK